MTSIKKLMEIYDKHENLHSGMSHEEQEFIMEDYRKTSCHRAVKLREIAEMLPEIKRALLRANQGIPYPTNKPGFMALKGKLEKWEKG